MKKQFLSNSDVKKKLLKDIEIDNTHPYDISNSVRKYTLDNHIELIEFDSERESLNDYSFFPDDRFVFILNLRDRININTETQSASLPSFYHLLWKPTAKKIKVSFFNKHHKGCILLCSEKHLVKTMEDNNDPFFIAEFYNEKMRISRPNLVLCDRVAEIKNNNKEYHDKLIALGYANIILGIALNQAIAAKNGTYSRSSSLSDREIRSIQELIKEINERPSFDYSVDYLARKAGISIPKLQTGFKEMQKMTVANYIRDVRLQKSEELLKSSDMNVSEIVYSIGFSSRSYFSRIFKGKYNCSPSEYQKNCQVR